MTQAAQFLPLMKPETSSIVSISGIPSGKQANSVMVKEGGEPVPKMARMVLEGIFAYHCWRATRARTNYGYMFVNPNGNDLTTLAGLIRTGSLRPVVGSVVSFNNIEAVQAACKIVLSGKGGLGKAVMELDN